MIIKGIHQIMKIYEKSNGEVYIVNDEINPKEFFGEYQGMITEKEACKVLRHDNRLASFFPCPDLHIKNGNIVGINGDEVEIKKYLP